VLAAVWPGTRGICVRTGNGAAGPGPPIGWPLLTATWSPRVCRQRARGGGAGWRTRRGALMTRGAGLTQAPPSGSSGADAGIQPRAGGRVAAKSHSQIRELEERLTRSLAELERLRIELSAARKPGVTGRRASRSASEPGRSSSSPTRTPRPSGPAPRTRPARCARRPSGSRPAPGRNPRAGQRHADRGPGTGKARHHQRGPRPGRCPSPAEPTATGRSRWQPNKRRPPSPRPDAAQAGARRSHDAGQPHPPRREAPAEPAPFTGDAPFDGVAFRRRWRTSQGRHCCAGGWLALRVCGGGLWLCLVSAGGLLRCARLLGPGGCWQLVEQAPYCGEGALPVGGHEADAGPAVEYVVLA